LSALTNSTSAPDAETTLAMLRQAIARMPANVDAMIGLAGTHLRLGQLDDAAQWCARAAALEQSARIARLRAAVEDALLKQARHEVIGGRMDAALGTLSRACNGLGSTTARLYRDLFATASQWFEQAADLPPQPGALRLSLPVWGADYVDAASTLLATLLAPGNLPALVQRRPVRLDITTTERDRAALEVRPIVDALRRHAAIDYTILPDLVVAQPPPPDFAYWIMSAAHHASLMRARRTGTDLSFLTADMTLSDGSLRAAQRFLDEGMQAVLVSALEVDPPRATPDGSALSVTTDEIVRGGLVRLGLEADEAAAPCRVLTPSSFAVQGGLATYSFHFLPLMVARDLLRQDFAPDLLTVDTRIVRLALGDASPEGRIKIVCDPSEIAIASSMSGARGPQHAAAPSGDALGRWAAAWCFAPQDASYFEWCFRHRIVYPRAGARVDPGPSQLEWSTVCDVISAFRHHAAARLAA
jgi:hypothetical protein